MDTYSPQPGITPTLRAAKDFQIYNYVAFSALALIIYDTILTIPRSIEYFKSRRFDAVSALYVCAQFGAMGYLAFEAFLNAGELSSISTSTCNGLSFAQDLCFGFAAIGIQGLLLGRAYAVAPHHKKSMILLAFIYMVNVGLAFVGNFQLSSVLDEFDHVVEGVVSLVEMRYPPRKFACYPEGVIAEVSLVIFDIGVLATTLYHAWTIRGVSHAFQVSLRAREHLSLTDLFIRQGIFRFMLITAWSTADAFAYKFARPSIAGVDEPLEVAISPILLSRFLFQLRKTHAESYEPSNQVELTTFQAAVRNIETNIRMELGDDDIAEYDHIRHPSPGNTSPDPSFRQDLENLGHYYAGGELDNSDDIRQRSEEPQSPS